MKPLVAILRTIIVSRALVPAVLVLFLLLYTALAFVTEEALTALMDLTRKNLLLSALLALIPISSLARLVRAVSVLLRRRDMMRQGRYAPGLFDEEVRLPDAPLEQVLSFLESSGYRVASTEGHLAAWRGRSGFPAKAAFRCATFCLYAGILISLTTRGADRAALIEQEPLPDLLGGGGIVEHLQLRQEPGLLLDRDLSIRIADQDGAAVYSLYPPGFRDGTFIYPRYLGIAPLVRFSAPDLPEAFESHLMLMIYPPGKEDSAEIPGSRYRIFFILEAPESEQDPFITGKMNLKFRLLRGETLLFDGTVPVGGEVARDGFRLAVPDFRRFVATDFVSDYGVWLIWLSGFLYALGLLLWLGIRLFVPRREMIFIRQDGSITACSRVEGRSRRHAGTFHEALDLLASVRTGVA